MNNNYDALVLGDGLAGVAAAIACAFKKGVTVKNADIREIHAVLVRYGAKYN